MVSFRAPRAVRGFFKCCLNLFFTNKLPWLLAIQKQNRLRHGMLLHTSLEGTLKNNRNIVS